MAQLDDDDVQRLVDAFAPMAAAAAVEAAEALREVERGEARAKMAGAAAARRSSSFF